MHPKGTDHMTAGLSLRNALVGFWWVTAVLLWWVTAVLLWVEKTVLSPCTMPISGEEALFPVWASGCRLREVTIASSLMGGCGLSHKGVEDGCKGTREVSGLKT